MRREDSSSAASDGASVSRADAMSADSGTSVLVKRSASELDTPSTTRPPCAQQHATTTADDLDGAAALESRADRPDKTKRRALAPGSPAVATASAAAAAPALPPVQLTFPQPQLWKQSYVRTRHKNLRCFPSCFLRHMENGFCGVSVTVDARIGDGSRANGDPAAVLQDLDVVVVGVLRKRDGDAHYAVGDPFSVVAPLDAAENDFVEADWAPFDGARQVWTLEFKPPRRWRYNCKLAKHTMRQQHVFSVYALSRRLGVCLATADSPAFRLTSAWKQPGAASDAASDAEAHPGFMPPAALPGMVGMPGMTGAPVAGGWDAQAARHLAGLPPQLQHIQELMRDPAGKGFGLPMMRAGSGSNGGGSDDDWQSAAAAAATYQQQMGLLSALYAKQQQQVAGSMHMLPHMYAGHFGQALPRSAALHPSQQHAAYPQQQLGAEEAWMSSRSNAPHLYASADPSALAEHLANSSSSSNRPSTASYSAYDPRLSAQTHYQQQSVPHAALQQQQQQQQQQLFQQQQQQQQWQLNSQHHHSPSETTEAPHQQQEHQTLQPHPSFMLSGGGSGNGPSTVMFPTLRQPSGSLQQPSASGVEAFSGGNSAHR